MELLNKLAFIYVVIICLLTIFLKKELKSHLLMLSCHMIISQIFFFKGKTLIGLMTSLMGIIVFIKKKSIKEIGKNQTLEKKYKVIGILVSVIFFLILYKIFVPIMENSLLINVNQEEIIGLLPGLICLVFTVFTRNEIDRINK
jgi:hypothetical protein